jgi:hypothetical protein
MQIRLDAWDQGKIAMLVQDTECCIVSYLSTKKGNLTTEQWTKIFHTKMMCGDVRGAVRYLTVRSKGGVLLPTDMDEKTGNSVIEVLESKHPDARIPDFSKLKKYSTTPDFADI